MNLQLVIDPFPPAQDIAPPSSAVTLFEVNVHLLIFVPMTFAPTKIAPAWFLAELLVNGEDFPEACFPCLRAQCANRKLPLCKVICSYYMIYAQCVGRRSVFVFRAWILIHITEVQNVVYVAD